MLQVRALQKPPNKKQEARNVVDRCENSQCQGQNYMPMSAEDGEQSSEREATAAWCEGCGVVSLRWPRFQRDESAETYQMLLWSQVNIHLLSRFSNPAPA